MIEMDEPALALLYKTLVIPKEKGKKISSSEPVQTTPKNDSPKAPSTPLKAIVCPKALIEILNRENSNFNKIVRALAIEEFCKHYLAVEELDLASIRDIKHILCIGLSEEYLKLLKAEEHPSIHFSINPENLVKAEEKRNMFNPLKEYIELFK